MLFASLAGVTVAVTILFIVDCAIGNEYPVFTGLGSNATLIVPLELGWLSDLDLLSEADSLSDLDCSLQRSDWLLPSLPPLLWLQLLSSLVLLPSLQALPLDPLSSEPPLPLLPPEPPEPEPPEPPLPEPEPELPPLPLEPLEPSLLPPPPLPLPLPPEPPELLLELLLLLLEPGGGLSDALDDDEAITQFLCLAVCQQGVAKKRKVNAALRGFMLGNTMLFQIVWRYHWPRLNLSPRVTAR